MESGARLWHVTVTVSGKPGQLREVREAMDRLLHERPFIDSLRFDQNRAELQYWEESPDMVDAASLALRLWNEHRGSAHLPEWEVVGLEVVDQATYKGRGRPTPRKLGSISPEHF